MKINLGINYLIYMLLFISLTAPGVAHSDDEYGEERKVDCHMHKTWQINFRNFEYKDVVELSVPPGPCETVVMTLIVRSDDGEDIYYMYGRRFAPHVTFDTEDPNFHKFIEPYLKNLHTHMQKNSKMLPKYHKQDAANGLIKLHVSLKEYRSLRRQHIPLFYHLVSHDRWQYVRYDAKKRRARVIVSGQLGMVR